MFVVMILPTNTMQYNFCYSKEYEYSGTKHDYYIDAEYELYDAREEGLTGYIKEVE